VEFTLPPVPDGANWIRLLDTNDSEARETSPREFGTVYTVTGRSLLLFALGLQNYRGRSLQHGIESLLDLTEATFPQVEIKV